MFNLRQLKLSKFQILEIINVCHVNKYEVSRKGLEGGIQDDVFRGPFVLDSCIYLFIKLCNYNRDTPKTPTHKFPLDDDEGVLHKTIKYDGRITFQTFNNFVDKCKDPLQKIK